VKQWIKYATSLIINECLEFLSVMMGVVFLISALLLTGILVHGGLAAAGVPDDMLTVCAVTIPIWLLMAGLEIRDYLQERRGGEQ